MVGVQKEILHFSLRGKQYYNLKAFIWQCPIISCFIHMFVSILNAAETVEITHYA